MTVCWPYVIPSDAEQSAADQPIVLVDTGGNVLTVGGTPLTVADELEP